MSKPASFGMTYAIVGDSPGDILGELVPHLRRQDELLLVQPGETTFSESKSPEWMARAKNTWGVVLYPYETLAPGTIELLQGLHDVMPMRFSLYVGLPDGGCPIRRPEVRVFHRESVGLASGALADGEVSTVALTESQARFALQQRLCASLQWLDQESNIAEPWIDVAGLYFSLGDFERAEHCARHAMTRCLALESINAMQLLANTLLFQGKYEAVIHLCHMEHAIGNVSASSWYALAQAEMSLGNLVGAAQACQASLAAPWNHHLTVDPTAEFERYALYSHILLRFDDPRAALQVLDQAGPEVESTSLGMSAKTAALAQLGNFDAAMKSLVPALQNDVIGAQALLMSADMNAQLGNFDEAASLYQKAWDAGLQEEEVFVRWLFVCQQLGDADLVQQAYAAYHEVKQYDTPTFIQWGDEFVASGDVEKAQHCYSEAMRRSPEDPAGYFRLARLLVVLERHGDAAHLFESGLKLTPDDSSGWSDLASCLRAMGLTDQAEEAMAKSRQHRPNLAAAIRSVAPQIAR